MTYKRQLLFVADWNPSPKNILPVFVCLYAFAVDCFRFGLCQQVSHHESFCGFFSGFSFRHVAYFTHDSRHMQARRSTSTFDFSAAVIFAQNATFCARSRFIRESCLCIAQPTSGWWGVALCQILIFNQTCCAFCRFSDCYFWHWWSEAGEILHENSVSSKTD